MSGDAYASIRREVVAGLGGTEWSDADADGAVREVAVRAVDTYQQHARHAGLPLLHDPTAMVGRVVRAVTDLGPLSDLLERDAVEEIFIEGARVSYLDRTGRLRGLVTPTNEDENRRLVDQLLVTTDRQLNATAPLVQARVLDGHARSTDAIPPDADALSVTLRRYTVREVSLRDLAVRGTLDLSAAAFLDAVM